MTLRLVKYALPTALFMAARAYRKGSLNRSGAVCAVLTGTLALSASVRFGLTLIVFFLGCSKVTRLGAKRKAEIEGREYAGPGGNRSWVQVLSNAATASAIALAVVWLRRSEPDARTEERIELHGAGRLRSLLQLAYVAHYACCNADTWASEIGVLSSTQPRLITDGRPVRAGTNGGVSPLGLGASIAGGLAIGATYAAAGLLLLPSAGSGGGGGGGGGGSAEWLALALGPAAGLFGSLADSLLGAHLQYSGYCPRRRCVVDCPAPGVQHICGRAWLSNSGVNFVSSLLTAACATGVIALLTRG